MAHNHSYKATVKKIEATGEVEIKSEISAAEFGHAIADTLEHVKKEVSIAGFRKGAAPDKMVRAKIGENALVHEAAEHAISHAYGHILEAEKIDAIGYPKVSITKIAEGNPLEFTIVTAVVPEIKNFSYTKIAAAHNAKKVEVITVVDADIEKSIEDIKNNYARAKSGTKDVSTATPIELTDELVKTWGEFKDVADFKTKLKQNLHAEKEQRAMEKRRLELVDSLTGALNIMIPEVLVETELARMTDQMRHDIERMGLTFEDYLKHLKKELNDLKKEWRNDAVKRVKLDLILNHIAKEEKITADKTKLDAEVKHAQEHHKDVDLDRARAYFEHIFVNQAVFEFLEKQK
jgi:FKBP-type peptidyl-prolyl cis-trans isomerase (trigger factor)